MKVITFATYSDGAFEYLKMSFEHFKAEGGGDEFVTVGWGQRWISFGDRLLQYFQYVKALPESEVCLLIDGYDIVITNYLQKFQDQFCQLATATGRGVLFSTEKHSFLSGLMNRTLMGPPSVKDKQPICAGAYIGYAGQISSMLQEVLEYPGALGRFSDDQRMLTEWVRKNPTLVNLDTDYDYFVTCGTSNSFNQEDAIEYHCDHTMTFEEKGVTHRPFCLHLPFAQNMRPILHKLGYDVDGAEGLEVKRDSTYYLKFFRHHGMGFFERIGREIGHWWNWLTVLLFIVFLIMMLVWLGIRFKSGVAGELHRPSWKTYSATKSM